MTNNDKAHARNEDIIIEDFLDRDCDTFRDGDFSNTVTPGKTQTQLLDRSEQLIKIQTDLEYELGNMK